MQPHLSRRSFMRSAAAVSAGFAGLAKVGPLLAAGEAGDRAVGYGPLVADPRGVLDLPRGFSYRIIGREMSEMDDGLLRPSMPDGAAAFPGPAGLTIHICNHELHPKLQRFGPFGVSLERLGKIEPAKFYDWGRGRMPGVGGTTTTVYDTRTGEVHLRYMSLFGTSRNCAGGPTPWNSWITCEETVQRADDDLEKDHGYCFEVPASAQIKVADPVPIVGMGRMNHEACAIDPKTGIVYLTEDRQDGALYRYLPNVPGKLAEGGRLQALAVVEQPSMDTRNWLGSISQEQADAFVVMGIHAIIDPEEHSPHTTPHNQAMAVKWIDVENVTSPEDDLREQVFANGGAKFARGEGMWWGDGCMYFACTSGGISRTGQIFRYVPGSREGQADESNDPGQLELYLEPNNHGLVKNADNLTVAPWGDLVLCEDSGEDNYLVGVTPQGGFYKLGFNAFSKKEFAGSCFSPDGSTLFVNIQGDGLTFAITGPWRT